LPHFVWVNTHCTLILSYGNLWHVVHFTDRATECVSHKQQNKTHFGPLKLNRSAFFYTKHFTI